MLYAALILGFTGSMHCIGMCSPLAMAVTNLSRNAWLNRLLYNIGRIFTYSLLGFAAASTESLLPVAQYQNIVSILLGVILLVMGIAGVSGIHIPLVSTALAKFIAILKKIFAHYLKKKNTGSVILLGAINGFLPCGLTFMALMFCLTLQGPWQGFSYMLAFGIGTLPAMLGLTALINPLMKRFQWSVRHVITVLLIASGCLMIARVFIDHTTHTIQPASTTEIVTCR
ncbi:MAG TPA: sulfite exporter TauE/SafE family protein [Ohtaekwangia sp.]|uniref:sulfite exporter TauE/SafE family protein n=1 Tax=Ohtaekwangia sp. TaxID=2066019 RepID=UPI002F9361C6